MAFLPTPARAEGAEAVFLVRRVAVLERRLARVLVQGERYRAWAFGTPQDGVWSRKHSETKP